MQYLSGADHHATFEDLYLEVRSKEARLVDDAVVARLPYVSEAEAANFREWQARAASFERLQRYFGKIRQSKSLLDIGCGNGWAAAGLAKNELLQVSAIDVNAAELEQADRVFRRPNLRFFYGDIFEDIFPAASFDFIMLNSSAQYFRDIAALVERLLHFLKPDGEIHIADTPFYKEEEVPKAKARTLAYYTEMGCPQMAEHYFHHSLSGLARFGPQLLSRRGPADFFKSMFSARVPENFAWIRIRKSD